MNVLVTGATGGIGRAICRAFAAEGARVMAADLPGAPVEPLVAELDELGGKAGSGAGAGAASIALDVSVEQNWIAAMDAMAERFGGIDVLVNNAGFYQPDIAFEDMPLDLWRKHFAVNSDGCFLGCKHAILQMKAQGRGGAIVNIGSGMSIFANPSGAAYCGSKAAVLMTTRTAARGAGKYGIRVNAVLPGAVDTPMLMGNAGASDDPEAYLTKMAAFSALGCNATPQDIAEGVLMLAGPQSRAITGVFLPVDGGTLPGA